MTKRINPFLYRLGYHFSWKNSWPILSNESEYIYKSILIRNFLEKILKKYEISNLNLFFYSDFKLNILIISNYSSIFFNNKMKLLKEIKEKINNFLNKKKIILYYSISILKKKNDNVSPYYVATHIANGLEKLKSLNFLVNSSYEDIKFKILGIRIEIKGRLHSATMKSKKIFQFGFLSLNTLDQKINSSSKTAFSKIFGTIGVKVYLLNKVFIKNNKSNFRIFNKSNILKKLQYLKNEDKIIIDG